MPSSLLPELKLVVAEALCQLAIAPSRLPEVTVALRDLVRADVCGLRIGRAPQTGEWVCSEPAQGEASLPAVPAELWASLPSGQIHCVRDVPAAVAGVSLQNPPAPGFAEACIARLDIDAGVSVQVCLGLRARAEGVGFAVEALSALGRFLPLLASTVAAQRRQIAMQALGGAIMNRYDRYHVGALVVDADGYLVYCNNAARRHLDAGSGMALRGGRLEAGLPHESALLLASIRDVLASDLPDSHFLSRLFSASREGDMPLTLAISPFRGRLGDGGYVTIMAYDPSRPDVNRKEIVQWTYHLSVRESELACALAAGESLEGYAERAECTLEGARSLLKRVYRKTGTSRQAELVKLVLAGPAAMVQ